MKSASRSTSEHSVACPVAHDASTNSHHFDFMSFPPQATRRVLRKTPLVAALHAGVPTHKRIAAYLASERRIPFNEQGIFRRYRELDA